MLNLNLFRFPYSEKGQVLILGLYNISSVCPLYNSLWPIAGLLEETNMIFEGMLKEGIMPDVIAYTALLSSLNRNGHPEKVFEVADRMLQNDICFNDVTYMELLISCSK